MSSDIFISYSSKEEAEARRVKKVLEDNGFSCWMAPDSIPVGSNYKLEIPDAISQCKAVVFIMSEKSQKSVWVQKEITDAINAKKLVIPYKIQDCPLEKDFSFMLNDVQQVPAYKNEEAALKKVIEDLRNALHVNQNEEIRITVKKRMNKMHLFIPVLAAAAVMIAFFGIRLMNSSNTANQITVPLEAGVYYSEILPYTKSGYYESFENTSGIVSETLDTKKAFSILSFIRNTKESDAFIESVSCDILELEADEKADLLFDVAITDDNVLKLFAINNGWGDSDSFAYTLQALSYPGVREFPEFTKSVNSSGSGSVMKESAVLLGEFPLELEEVYQWAEKEAFDHSHVFAKLSFSAEADGKEYGFTADFSIDPKTKSIEISYGGTGDGLDYSVTLYALLDVDNPPSSIRFTGNNATPLVKNTFRVETVIIPTKSADLKCRGVYSVDGIEQKTDVYTVHVSVPVFINGCFSMNGPGTQQLTNISMDDEQAVKRVLDAFRYQPESILEDHLNQEG